MASIHKENGGLLKYQEAVPSSTSVDYGNLDRTPAKSQDNRGSIGPQPEYFIPPQGNFPGITKELNDTMLDMVMGSSSALKLLRPAVGRVVTNLVRPVSYSVKQKLDIIKDVYQDKGIKGLLKAVIDDKPIYQGARTMDNMGREVPYRAMFDLKPRFGEAAYSNIDDFIKQNRSGSFDIVNELSFNPNSVVGTRNLRNVVDEVEFPKMPGQRGHITMGDFSAKRLREAPTGEVTGLDYKDIWDFGINKGELGKIGKAFTSGAENKKDLLSSVILRKLVDSITNPVTIKGTVNKKLYDDVVKQGLERGL